MNTSKSIVSIDDVSLRSFLLSTSKKCLLLVKLHINIEFVLYTNEVIVVKLLFFCLISIVLFQPGVIGLVGSTSTKYV